jgi:hypothetical protein
VERSESFRSAEFSITSGEGGGGGGDASKCGSITGADELGIGDRLMISKDEERLTNLTLGELEICAELFSSNC